jgi:hypothetical protein
MKLQRRDNRGQPPDRYGDDPLSKFIPKKKTKKRPAKTYAGSPPRKTGKKDDHVSNTLPGK